MSTSSSQVFLSHNSRHKPAVVEIAMRLRKEGVDVWLDKWNLIPGERWQDAIEGALHSCQSCLVFVGPGGMGPWQHEEMRGAIDRRVSEGKKFRVIPVLLPGTDRPDRSQIPSFLTATTWVEFRKTLDDDDALRRLICGIRGIKPRPSETIDEGICPYRGLEVFQPEDEQFFFGREAETEWLLEHLRPKQESQSEKRFLAIVGASGSGKSSLARAGLIPALKQGRIPGSSEWPILICRPAHNPIESIAVALAADDAIGPKAPAVGQLINDLKREKETLHLTTRVGLHNSPGSRRVVLLVDQFEELFTNCDDETLRQATIENLLYAASMAAGRTIVVLTMRADFYGKCASYPALASAVSSHQELVGPMTKTELQQAIEKPAQLVGCEFEPGLVEMLIQAVNQQAGALPLLQYTLEQLWHRRDGRRLTVAGYQDLGELQGALEKRANQIFEGFSQQEQDVCRRLFLRLTQPGEGTEDTKRRVAGSELTELEGVEKVLQKLANARLVITEGDKEHPKAQFVEVSHEALIRGWPRLRQWLDADRESLLILHRLIQAAGEWYKQHKDVSFLYRGSRLLQTEEWAKTHRPALASQEEEFLNASKADREKQRREKEERRKQERQLLQQLAEEQTGRADEAERREEEQRAASQKLRRRAMMASCAAVIAVIFAVTAFVMYSISDTERRQAEHQTRVADVGKLVALSREVGTRFPERRVLLAIAAVNKLPIPSAEQALRDALANIGGTPLRGHEESISDVAIGPNGRWLVTGSWDTTARLWDLESEEIEKSSRVLRGHEDPISDVAIGPKGRWLVTGSDDNTARLWDLRIDELTKRARSVAGRELTLSEREQYITSTPN